MLKLEQVQFFRVSVISPALHVHSVIHH